MLSWDRQWYGPVAAIRPFLFHKCMVLMVAMDLLVLMVERGGRYGLDVIPFNVPHFVWLTSFHQLFLPFGVPTAEYYVCVVVVTSFLAFCHVVGGHRRWLMALITVLYTYAWSMSRLDSYLHHYMLSLILSCLVFFPAVDGRRFRSWWENQGPPRRRDKDVTSMKPLAWTLIALAVAYRFSLSQAVGLTVAQRWVSMFVCCGLLAVLVFRRNRTQVFSDGPRVSSWAYRLLGTTVGVIYVFTSIAKMDMEWCGGHTLQQVGATAQVLSPVEQMATAIGIPRDWFWAGLATFVIPLELTLAGSYIVATRQDEPGRTWLRRWCFFAWALAVGLHLNNEMMNLVIQWFGYYMLLLATLFLLPERILLTLGTPFIWCESSVRDQYERLVPLMSNGQAAVAFGALTAGALVSLLLCGVLTWIAGAGAATLIIASGLVMVVVYGMIAGWERGSIKVSLVSLVASWMMIVTVAQCSMRFDYYDLRGKTLQQLGNNERAIAQMETAAVMGPPTNAAAAELHTNLGLAYRYTQKPKLAEQHYRKATGLDARQFLAHYGLANLLVAYDERHAEAAHHYRQALAIKSDFSDAYVNLGSLLEYDGQIDQAIECYEAALAIEKSAPDVRQLLQQAQAKRRASAAIP